MDRRNYALLLILLLAASPAIYSAYYTWAVPAPSIGATVEPGSLAGGYDYEVYYDSGSIMVVKLSDRSQSSYSDAATAINYALTNGNTHIKGDNSGTPRIYSVQSTLNIPSNRHFTIETGVTLRPSLTGSYTTESGGGTNKFFIVNSDIVNGNTAITIDGGGLIDGTLINDGPPPTFGLYGITFQIVSVSKIVGVRIQSMSSFAVRCQRCSDVWVIDSWIRSSVNVGTDGIHLVDSFNVTVSRNNILANDDGIVVDSTSLTNRDIIIEHNIIGSQNGRTSGCAALALNSHNTQTIEKITFLDNQILPNTSGCDALVMRLVSGSGLIRDIQFMNNRISGTRFAVSTSLTSLVGFVFAGNIVTNTTSDGAQIFGGSQIKVYNNDFRFTNGLAFRIQAVGNLTMVGNRFSENVPSSTDCVWIGISGQGVSDYIINENSIHHCTGDGMEITDGNSGGSNVHRGIISNNAFYDNSVNPTTSFVGLRITGTTRNTLFTNNLAYDSHSGGSKTQNNGIFIGSSTSNNEYLNNDVRGNTSPNGFTGTFNSGDIAINNQGFNPVNDIASFIITTFIGKCGTGTTIAASTDYVVCVTPVFLTSTGGTAVSITVKDGAGNTVTGLSGLATITAQYLPIGYKINFGAFSGAPTVTVFGT